MNGASRSSDNNPLERPEIGYRAARATIRAVAMGLAPAETVAPADPESLDRLVGYVQQAGIGRGLVREAAMAYDADRLASLLDDLEEAMARSPVPETEWPAMEGLFGPQALAGYLAVSPSSLRRYAAGERPTPDDVAARLHFLALVAGDLAGSYNEIGVRRWFERKRSQLDGRTPAELLRGAWDPEDPGPARVRELAAALLASPVT